MRCTWLIALLGCACVAPLPPDDSSPKTASVVVEEPGPPSATDAAEERGLLDECPPDADADTYPDAADAERAVAMGARLFTQTPVAAVDRGRIPEILHLEGGGIAFDLPDSSGFETLDPGALRGLTPASVVRLVALSRALGVPFPDESLETLAMDLMPPGVRSGLDNQGNAPKRP